MIRKIVHSINDTLRHKFIWPTSDTQRETEAKILQLCGLPRIVEATDYMHILIFLNPILG